MRDARLGRAIMGVMDPIHVRDPDEMPWAVGVPLLPWRPRWRGPGRPDPTATSDTVADSGTRFGLDVGGEMASALFDDGPWVLVVLAVLTIAVFAVPFLLFAFALALEVVLVALLALGVLVGRVLLRRPFAVVAVAADGRRRQWRVRGLGAAREWAPHAADAIRVGTEPAPPP